MTGIGRGRRILAAALLSTALLAVGSGAQTTDLRMVVGDSGLEAPLRSSSMVAAALASQDPAPTPQDIVTAARAEYANLLGLLYDRGYYGPEVRVLIDGREAASMSPFAIPARIDTVVIQVNPGKRFTFGKAAIGPLAPGQSLPEDFAPGQTAGAAIVRDAVGAAARGWREIGHAKAHAGPRSIIARHPQAQLDVEIQILPGPKLQFGNLIVRGNENVRTRRIIEIAGLRTGRDFLPEDLDAVVRRLRKTGAFRSVSVEEAETPGADGRLDVAVTVVEDLPRRFGFGAEISSSEGGMLSGYWMHRNFLGGAERLRFDARASGMGMDTGSIRPGGTGVDYLLGVGFARPGTWSAANTLGARLQLTHEDEPDYFARTALAEVSLTRELNARTEITVAAQLRFSDVEDELGKRQMLHFLLPMTGQLDARDNVLNPKGGYFLRLEAQPFVGLDDVSENGFRLYADARGYFTPSRVGRLTLAGRLQFGTVMTEALDGTPRDFLFYSGGGGTVRGQPFRSLHDTLPSGATIGGTDFLGLSAEARVGVTDKISLVGFYDWGQISAENNIGAGLSHSGAGLGLRYDTPIGPIRLDVAAPVSGTTGKGVQVYVGIGQAF